MNGFKLSRITIALLLVAAMLAGSIVPMLADDSSTATIPSEMLKTVDGSEYVVFDFESDTTGAKYKIYNAGGYNAVYDSEKAALRLIPGSSDSALFDDYGKTDEFGNPIYVIKTNGKYRDFGLNLCNTELEVRKAVANRLNTNKYAILTYCNDSSVSAMQYIAGGTYDVSLRCDGVFNSVIIPLSAENNPAVYRHPDKYTDNAASLVAFGPITENYTLPLEDVKIYWKSLAYASTYEDAIKWCRQLKADGTISNYHDSLDASHVDVGVKTSVEKPAYDVSLGTYYNSKFNSAIAGAAEWTINSAQGSTSTNANGRDISLTAADYTVKDENEIYINNKKLSEAATSDEPVKYLVMTLQNTGNIPGGFRKWNSDNGNGYTPSQENVYYIQDSSDKYYSIIINIYDETQKQTTLFWRNNINNKYTNVFMAFYPMGQLGSVTVTDKTIKMRTELPLFKTYDDAVDYCKYLYSEGLSSGYYDNAENPTVTVPTLGDSKFAAIPAKSIDLALGSSVNVDIGETLDLNKLVKVYPRNTTDTEITYTISDNTAVSLTDGVIEGIAQGKAEITVSVGTLSKTFTVFSGYPDYYVYDHNALNSGNALTLCSNMTKTVEGDFVKLEITADTADAKVFFDPQDSILCELYPVMKMVYKVNIQNYSDDYYTDLSAIISPVKIEGKTENRLYSYKPALTNGGVQATYLQDLSVKGIFPNSQVGNGIGWSDTVSDSSTYKRFWFYNWHKLKNNATAGDTFEIAYIGFFKNTEDAEAYNPLSDPTAIKLSETVYTMAPGENYTLEADVYPSMLSQDNKQVSWESSAADVVSVENGIITAHKVGTAVITAKTVKGELFDSCFVSVLEKPAKPLSLNKYTGTMTRVGKIAFLGDSITAGSQVTSADIYFNKLAEKYAFNAAGWGYSGSNISCTGSSNQPSFIERVLVKEGGAWSDPNVSSEKYSAALAAKNNAKDADVIFILGGINDFGQNKAKFSEFGNGVQTLIDSLKQEFPNSQLVFSTPLKNSGYFSTDTNNEGKKLEDFVLEIARICAENSVPFINAYDLFDEFCTYDSNGNVLDTGKNPTDYYADGVHPNAAGHALMAERFESELVRLGIVSQKIDCVVLSAGEIINNATTVKMTGESIYDEATGKSYAHFKSTYSGNITDMPASERDNSVNFTINYPNGVNANDYPVMKIVYRTNHGGLIDISTGIGKAGTDGFKYYGYRGSFDVKDGSEGSHILDMYSTYNGNSKNVARWSEYIPQYPDALITYQIFKVVSNYNTAITSDAYYDVEYIGLFKTVADAKAYVYTPSVYEVSFNDKDSNVIETKSNILAGATIDFPTAPVIEGLTFVGWIDNTADELIYGKDKLTVNKDMTLTAYYRNTINNIDDYISKRGADLNNLRYKLAHNEGITVAYLGGSVTYGHGSSDSEKTSWRALTGAKLNEIFNGNVTTINAAIGGSGSALGAFRVDTDVIAKNPDLVFVEYTVNDGYSNATNKSANNYAAVQKYYETVIRKIRTALPQAEIITVYTTDSAISRNKGVSAIANVQDDIAKHYDIASVNVGKYFTDSLISSDTAFEPGKAPWNYYMSDNVHPLDSGYAIYAELVNSYFEYAFGQSVPTGLNSYNLPRYYSADAAKLDTSVISVNDESAVSYSGFTHSADSKLFGMTEIKGVLTADKSSAENTVSVDFTGTGVAVFMNFGHRANYNLYYSLDGGDYVLETVKSSNHPLYIDNLHGLENTSHTVSFKFTDITGNVPQVSAFLIENTTERTVTLKYRASEGSISAASNDPATEPILGNAITDDDGNTTQNVTVYKGSKVTFAAKPESDYRIDGWYSESNSKLTDGAVYVLDVNEDVTLNARFFDINVASSVMLSVAVSDAGKVSVNDDEASDFIPSDYYSSRDDIKLTALPNNGYSHAYWFRVTKDNTRVFLTDNNTCYVKPLGNSVVYQPLFTKTGVTETIYVDSANVILFEGGEPLDRTIPERFGYVADTENYSETGGWKLTVNNDSLKVYVASYKRADDVYTLSVDFADNDKVVDATVQVKYDERVTINASSESFSHWTVTFDGKTQIISYKKQFVYNHVLLGDATITEVCGTAQAAPTVIALTSYLKTDRAWFVAAFDLPSGYSLVERGVLMTSDSESASAESFNLINTSGNIIVGRIEQSESGATSVFMIAKANPNTTWYGRPYLIYKDVSGKQGIIYGDVLTCSAS